jgi:hypothetical protein
VLFNEYVIVLILNYIVDVKQILKKEMHSYIDASAVTNQSPYEISRFESRDIKAVASVGRLLPMPPSVGAARTDNRLLMAGTSEATQLSLATPVEGLGGFAASSMTSEATSGAAASAFAVQIYRFCFPWYF